LDHVRKECWHQISNLSRACNCLGEKHHPPSLFMECTQLVQEGFFLLRSWWRSHGDMTIWCPPCHCRREVTIADSACSYCPQGRRSERQLDVMSSKEPAIVWVGAYTIKSGASYPNALSCRSQKYRGSERNPMSQTLAKAATHER